jgi:anti-sigma factor RsiW
MNCTEVTDRCDRYLDGRLDVSEADALRAHVAGCRSCADELEFIRELRVQVAALPRSLDPPHDLWPGVATLIADATVVRGRFVRRMLMAAAAATLVAGSVVTSYYVGRQVAVTKVVQAPTPDPGLSEILLVSLAGLGVDDYGATRAALLDALEARQHELSPETMRVVRENLLVIDRAMDSIATALGEDPENQALMRQLAGTYRRQVDLLQRAVRLPSDI